MDIADLIHDIYLMDSDDDLQMIWRAYSERSKQLRQRRAAMISATLNVGDRIRIAEDVRPARLAGATGTVRGQRNTKWIVELDSGEQLRVGASAIRLEEAS
jgi:ribosomal protein L21E